MITSGTGIYEAPLPMPFSRLCVAAFVALGCATRDAEPPRRDNDRPYRAEHASTVVGTWRILRQVGVGDSSSTSRLPFGAAPLGYIVYDATGHVFFQVARRNSPSQAPTGRWRRADSSALQQVLTDASAYFGTYTIDAESGTMVHHIESEIPPNQGTIEMATPYQVRGDTLVLAHWLFLRVR
jgi:hypothetical protein